ncbi:MAG TPA: hypothetical protein VFA10_01560 [Ktedonobacteraceae bacterium]|nr:hypothetical protein [Ktedonobacteraceae bacterium]
MDHPDESMLLAFTRRQVDGWPGEVERHISQCLACHARYNEYQRINEILVDATRAPADRAYPSITEAVIQKVHELEISSNNLTRVIRAVRKGYRSATRTTWRLVGPSLAAAAVILCALIVFALATTSVQIPTSLAGSSTEFKPTMTGGQSKGQQRPMHTVVATATRQPTSGGTVARGPSITVCSSPADVKQNRLRICGQNFKPGNRVSLIIIMQGSQPKELKPVLVQADGTMQVWFPLNSCAALPSAIVAQYANGGPVLTTLGNIQFGKCNSKSHNVHSQNQK